MEAEFGSVRKSFYDVTTGFYQGSTSVIDIQGSTVTGNVSDSDNE